ncbi:hypothetical protein Godav_024275 [Gossypium davidsonii]|uniref:Uncharacterized protein n=1 Tax=Gossypium davidsonii TaxID=34287 RepID=A0A7J8SVC9_GOSDV|nr:hypothetical protein [Gossypium davidsonii]
MVLRIRDNPCRALCVFVMLFLYEAILVSRYTVFLVECRASPEDFRYKKGNVCCCCAFVLYV